MGKWDYPKHMTKTKTTSDMGSTNAGANRQRRKEWRKNIKAKAHKHLMGHDRKVKNPVTGKEILATTAYKAGPNHPAYDLAKRMLRKELVEYFTENNIPFVDKG